MKTTINCRHCNEPIAITIKDPEVRIFHNLCYAEFLKNFKEYGIRIGMRVHKNKGKSK